jgi:hypothetical protein
MAKLAHYRRFSTLWEKDSLQLLVVLAVEHKFRSHDRLQLRCDEEPLNEVRWVVRMIEFYLRVSQPWIFWDF